ncbi:MAG: GMC family oxidoreductase [Pseudomonadota bacterium]
MTVRTCDFLIIGGGAAGCIVARRLADAGIGQVILVEAGRSDEGDPAATDLSRLDEQDESYDWGYRARAHPAAPRPMDYARARLLGGCANHNDCAFLIPPESDFDRWRQLGAHGWDSETTARCFKRIENQLHIEPAPEGGPLSRAFVDAGREFGLPERCFRNGVEPGAGWFPLNARGRLRQSSSIGYLHPLKTLPETLQVLTETRVTRLIIDGRRVTGIETERGCISVRRDVILCAGSINTPQLLMLSGIGPAEELQAHAIPVVVDLSGVGRNLVDHVAANIVYETAIEPTWERTPCEATLLASIHADVPDVLFHFVLRLREKYVGGDQFAGVPHGVKISPNVTRPKSRGTVRLGGPDPETAPVIDLNYFSDTDGYDARTLNAGLRLARRLADTSSLRPHLVREVAPGPDVQSDKDFIDYIRATCETVYHPAGTCRMGAVEDLGTVVDPCLKLTGLDGLRIADASVFPDMVTVNICNTVMMVAERAAELILADT